MKTEELKYAESEKKVAAMKQQLEKYNKLLKDANIDPEPISNSSK